jgi:hypothetical protein
MGSMARAWVIDHPATASRPAVSCFAISIHCFCALR